MEESNDSYKAMLDRIEGAISNVQPYGFNEVTDADCFLAKKDVLKAINKLRLER